MIEGRARHLLSDEWSGDWSKGNFTRFELVFFVSLRLMKQNDHIENLILRQNESLRKMSVSPGKLRKMLETFGEKCLLILDGWGEHTGACNDVVKIIRKEHLPDCTVVVTSRSEFADEEEIRERFNVVANCEGFPRNYAERFAKNILMEQELVDKVLNIYVDNDSLKLGAKKCEPLFKNPTLFLYVCILANIKEIELIEPTESIKIGEIYFRIIHYLYRQFSFQEKVFKKDDESFVTWMKTIGKIAFRMIKQEPYKISRKDLLRDKSIYHWGILTSHVDRYPTFSLSDEIYLTFPSFSIQEFFAAFYYKKFISEQEEKRSEVYLLAKEYLLQPRHSFVNCRIIQKSKMFEIFLDYVT